jgi:hypothetical protein
MYLDDDTQVALMRRAISAPGSFATDWPGVTSADLAAMLADGFATAQFQGWFPASALDYDAMEVTPDLSTAGLMLAVSYAAIKVLRLRLLTMQQGSRFKAGPVEAEFSPMATVLVALLKSLEAEIDFIRNSVANHITPIVGDLVSVRLMGSSGFTFETSELPSYRLGQSDLSYRHWSS